MEQEHIYIRRMTKEDIPSVKELNSKLFPLTYSDKTYESYCTPRFLSLLLFVGEEKKLAGISVSIRIWKDKYSSKRDGYLSSFGIIEEYRNKGIGSMFLNLTTYILTKHYSVLHVMLDMMKEKVNVFNFYKKNGYIGYRVKTDYYNINDKKHDAILMVYNASKNDCQLMKYDNVELEDQISKMLVTKNRVPPLFPGFFVEP